jgi:anti-sigma factor ChrR (cupin superfamily)
MHLAMCRHCRAFTRRIEAIGRAARDAGRGFEREPASDFETRILSRLER